MFDLERQIQDWKMELMARPALRRADVEDLEQHVRDGLPTLVSAGLNPEEAFLIATRRVGSPAAIEREFAKVNAAYLWSQRVFWIVLGALGYVVCRLAIGAAASVAQALAGLAGGSGSDVGYAGLTVACAGWIVVAAALYRQRDASPDGWTIRPAGVVGAGATLVLVLAVSMNFAGEVVLFQLMRPADAAYGTFVTGLATKTAAVLVPLVMFIAMVFRMRDRASVPD
jgi:hypothetical protein